MDSQSSGKLSGVAIGRRSPVHIENMRQSLKVVTTSALLAPSQLPPVSAQPLTTPHHEDTEHVNSTGTRTPVQAAVVVVAMAVAVAAAAVFNQM